jgi:hypothetical protein
MSLEGIADLPLHEGHVPPWLASIMKRLAHAILRVMVEEFGPDKIIERFSNPLWFQAFNNVIGMDWDSSGSTTVTTGILKTVTWSDPSLGFLVLGGKGGRARRVPDEIPQAVKILRVDANPDHLIKISRLVAKIDSILLQDRYTLYHHTLFVSENGRWCIVQQGMNIEKRFARRYHWLDDTRDMYSDPHKAVSGVRHDIVLNLVARDSMNTRKTILDLLREKPEKIVADYSRIYNMLKNQPSLLEYLGLEHGETGLSIRDPRSKLVVYAPLPMPNELLKRLKIIYEAGPETMDQLLLIRRVVNDKVLRALALISDLIYNEPPSYRDPVNTPYDPFKYAYAIGGKDGVPYPVDRRTAEEVIYTLEDIINRAKIGDKERLRALKNLSRIRLRII